MRVVGILMVLVGVMMSCDDRRVYEEYVDFEERYWLVNERPEFEFVITDPRLKYNIYSNVRNDVSYPWSRLFLTYHLQDSTGAALKKEMVTNYLFDGESGEPLGSSGLGDIYDHQFLLLKDYRFSKAGKYKMRFEQVMRTDTLEGMLAVGLRVEKVSVE
ncbi:MAG TPA: gliding motility lipoprotein GldH [Ohtaekwangia sp.]|nr:gliding motility lipoprotein GldH [Ohtaekwangia sp.]